MSQIIVQKLNGLKAITPLIQSNKVNVQRCAVALVGNLTKNPNLHNSLGKKHAQDKNWFYVACANIHSFISFLHIFSLFEKENDLLVLYLNTIKSYLKQ